MRQETLLTLAREREGSVSGAAFRSDACCRTLRFHIKLLMLKARVSFSLTYSLRITNTGTGEFSFWKLVTSSKLKGKLFFH